MIMRKRGSSPGVVRGQVLPQPRAGPGAPAGGTPPLFTPDPLFLVWMEGLPAQEDWSFHNEYVEPCIARYGASFLEDRSFLVDRHDLQAAQVPAFTWGVLAFNEPEAAKECGMAVAAGPLAAPSLLPCPPPRVTVRRRIMAPQDTLDQLAAEMQRQHDEQAGKLVARQLAQAEARRAAGTAGGAMPVEMEEEAPPPPPPASAEEEVPPPPPPPAAAEEGAPLPPPLPQQRQQAAHAGLKARIVPSPTHPPLPPEPAEQAAPPAPPLPPEAPPSPAPPPPPADDLGAGLFFSASKLASQPVQQAQQAIPPQAAAQPPQGGGAPPENSPDAGLFFTQGIQQQRRQAAGAALVQRQRANAASTGGTSKEQPEARPNLPRSPYDSEQPVQPREQQRQVGKQASKHSSAAAGATAPAAKGSKQQRHGGKGPGTAARTGGASMPAAVGGAAASKAKHGRQGKQLEPLDTAPRKQAPAGAEPALGSPRTLDGPRSSSKGFAAAATAAEAAAAAEPAAAADEGIREKVRARLQQGLQLAADELQELGEQSAEGSWDAVAAAAAVEAALLEQHGGATSKQYREKARSLSMNLKAPDNRELRQQVLRREIAPKELVCMSSEQLAPRSLQQRREQLRQESLRQAVLPPDLAAQVSTAAALELKRLLGSQGGLGTPSATPLGGSRPGEDDGALPATEAAAAEPAHAGTPSAQAHADAHADASAGFEAEGQPAGVRPGQAPAASPRLGNAAAAVVAVGGTSPLKPLSQRAAPSAGPVPPHSGPRSPGDSSGGGYASDHEAAAAIWDDEELGFGPDEEDQPAGTAGLAAAAAAATSAPAQQQAAPLPRALPSAPQAAALLLQESSDEERAGTPDLGAPEAAALPPHQAQQAQRAGTPDLEADEAALLAPALAAAQQAQQAQRAGTPDLEADEAALLAPALVAAQQAQQAQRAGTPDLEADEAALLAPALVAAAAQQAQQAQRAGTPDLEVDEAALLAPAIAAAQQAQLAQCEGTPDLAGPEQAGLAPVGALMPRAPDRAGTPDLCAGEAAALQAQQPPAPAQQQQDVPTEQERQRLRQQRWQQRQAQQAAEQAQQLAAQQQDGGERAAEQEQQRRDGRARESGEHRAGSKRRDRSRSRSRQLDREYGDRRPGHAGKKGSGRSERGTKPGRSRSRSRSRHQDKGPGERRSPHASNKRSSRGERSPKPSRRSSSRDGHGRRKDRRKEGEEGGAGSGGRAKRRRSEERRDEEERRRGSGSGPSDACQKPRRERDFEGSRSSSPSGKRRRESGGSERRASGGGSSSKHGDGDRRADKGAQRKRSRSCSRERRRSRGSADTKTGGSSTGMHDTREHSPAAPAPPVWQPVEQPAAWRASPPPPLPAAPPAVESLPPGFGAQQHPLPAVPPAAPPEHELQEQLSFDLPALGWGWGTQRAQQAQQARHLDPRLQLRQHPPQHQAPQQPAGVTAAPGPPQTLFQQPSGGLDAWQAGPPQEQAQQVGWQEAAQPLQAPQPDPLWHQPSAGVEILREEPPTGDAEPFWRGHLEWPQAGGAHLLRLPVSAQGWSSPNDGSALQLPERLTVTATMPGSQLMPFLSSLSIPSCKVCWFLLSPGAATDQLLGSQDLRDDKVGVCQLRLDGTQLFDEQQWWQGGGDQRGWVLHLLKPNDEVNFFAGVLPEDVAAAGPGALLALALPAWHGWLYVTKERYHSRQPNCAVRMLGPPLLHDLPPQLVLPYRIRTDLAQFVEHQDELMQQGLILKARRTADGADVEALRAIVGGLRQARRVFALPLGRAEMLLLPHRDGKHLQAALWSLPGRGAQVDRTVFDPWSLRLEGLLAPRA